jgi:hypothetical protein
LPAAARWRRRWRSGELTRLAALVVAIATINAFNRLNAATRQITGPWVARIAQAPTGAAV